uniref:Leucine-rich repeat domain-containing protein n=1 Tax=Panagrellus redivivus TaxID=6233 RepID=A0A7E4W5V4_PANRE
MEWSFHSPHIRTFFRFHTFLSETFTESPESTLPAYTYTQWLSLPDSSQLCVIFRDRQVGDLPLLRLLRDLELVAYDGSMVKTTLHHRETASLTRIAMTGFSVVDSVHVPCHRWRVPNRQPPDPRVGPASMRHPRPRHDLYHRPPLPPRRDPVNGRASNPMNAAIVAGLHRAPS